MSSLSVPSPALLAANERLQRKQACVRAARQEQMDVPWLSAVPEAAQSPTSAIEERSLARLFAHLPRHLGWGSATVTAAYRRRSPSGSDQSATTFDSTSPVEPPSSHPPRLPETTKHYPDLGVGMLRLGLTAPGRLWLLCRLLDRRGQGMLEVSWLKAQFTAKDAATFICGPRQLRSLLQQGKGVFWTRDKTRVWLHGAARVAAAMGVERFHGRPVALPVNKVLADALTFRAHMYAAFHAGRNNAGNKPRPIARETIAALTGVRPALQRKYEQLARVRAQRNLAVGERKENADMQDTCWLRGGGTFILRDSKGKQGRPGGEYLAWQLPNSYETTLNQRPKGPRKRLNARLADLSMQGMTGNGERQKARRSVNRRYFDDGAAAGRAFGGAETLYWRRVSDGRRADLWQAMEPYDGTIKEGGSKCTPINRD